MDFYAKNLTGATVTVKKSKDAGDEDTCFIAPYAIVPIQLTKDESDHIKKNYKAAILLKESSK